MELMPSHLSTLLTFFSFPLFFSSTKAKPFDSKKKRNSFRTRTKIDKLVRQFACYKNVIFVDAIALLFDDGKGKKKKHQTKINEWKEFIRFISILHVWFVRLIRCNGRPLRWNETEISMESTGLRHCNLYKSDRLRHFKRKNVFNNILMVLY